MKKMIICGAVVIVLGLLIAFGPQFLFKTCSPVAMATEEVLIDDCGDDGSCSCSGTKLSFPLCHWSARAEIGIGFLIAALGICLIVFTDLKTQQGLTIGVFLSSIIALSVPHVLIGGCKASTMDCRRVAFPALTVIGIVLLIFSIIILVCSERKKTPAEEPAHASASAIKTGD